MPSLIQRLPKTIALIGMLFLAGCQHDDDSDNPLGCSTVTGMPVATFSTNAGKTLARNGEEIERVGAGQTSFARTSSDQPVLFAADWDKVYASTNDGCHWEAGDYLGGSPRQLVTSGDDAYALVIHYEVGQSPSRSVQRITSDLAATSIDSPEPAALATTSDDANALYLLSTAGEVVRSVDGGDAWTQQGTAVPGGSVLAINPGDQLHMVVMGDDGLQVSFDGGLTWQASTISDISSEVIAYQFAFEEGSDHVWVKAMRRDFDDQGNLEQSEMIVLRSTDGGTSYQEITQISVAVADIGQIATRPGVPGEIYLTEVIGGSCPQASHRLFRYNASSGTLETFTHPREALISGVMFHPEEEDVLYVGNAESSACVSF